MEVLRDLAPWPGAVSCKAAALNLAPLALPAARGDAFHLGDLVLARAGRGGFGAVCRYGVAFGMAIEAIARIVRAAQGKLVEMLALELVAELYDFLAPRAVNKRALLQ